MTLNSPDYKEYKCRTRIALKEPLKKKKFLNMILLSPGKMYSCLAEVAAICSYPILMLKRITAVALGPQFEESSLPTPLELDQREHVV